ncbi:hypothetical protein [Candidatus Electrothrix sp.]|uniref:hypothetical protein n=1 Tax=Candidatus Electrothrix sp. TaxID=2170559 RepID=UPI004056A8AF
MSDLIRKCASSVFFRGGANIFFKGIFCTLITVSLLTIGPLFEALAEEKADVGLHSSESWFEQKMNLDCNGRAVEEVLKEVASFFKTKIIYQSRMAKVPIHCSYLSVTVEEILRRLFKDQNNTILLGHAPERKIIVQVFGETKYNIVSSDGSTGTEIIPFLPNMTNEDLARLHKEQLRLYKKELANPDAIIPGVGITRQDLATLHKEQLRLYKKELANPEAIIPGVGITREELRVLHQNQIQQYEMLKNDPDQIIPGTNITRQQLQELHQKQLKLYEQSKNDQDELDPFTGLTRSELKKLHEQQIRRSDDSADGRRVTGQKNESANMSE